MDRVFLDANVLFSAAYDSAAATRQLWRLPAARLITSPYAAAEAYRNLADKRSQRLRDLSRLMEACGLVTDTLLESLPDGVSLPERDRPILLAATAAAATHLLTGDKHFRSLFGRTVGGVLVLRPGDYLRLRR